MVTNIFSALNGGHISPMGSISLLLLIHISSLMVEVDSRTSQSSDPTSNRKRWQHDLCHLYTGLIAHHGELGWRGTLHKMNPEMFFYRIASFRKRKYCVQEQNTLKCDVTCPECVFLCPLFSSQASGQTLHSMVITGQTNAVAKLVIYRTTKEYRRNNKTDVLTFANICTQQELAKLIFST